MDQDLESKQFFLRSEILEKGFDGEEFFQFLISKKGDEGGDLNNWTMFDLKIAVSEFQVSHKSQTEPVPLPSQPSLDQQNYQYPQFEQVPLDNNQGFNQNQSVAPVPENQSTLPTLSTIQEVENRLMLKTKFYQKDLLKSGKRNTLEKIMKNMFKKERNKEKKII